MKSSKTGYIQSEIDPKDIILGCPEDFQLPKVCTYENLVKTVKDQGSSMKCVAYSLSSALEIIYALNNSTVKLSVDDIYNSRSNTGEGMCIKDGLKYIKKTDHGGVNILSYGKLPSLLPIKYNLLTNGPCIMALPVCSNNTDFWNGNEQCGGHAIVCIGYDEEGFILLNSWGRNWGYDGKCILPYDQLNKLIECWGVIA